MSGRPRKKATKKRKPSESVPCAVLWGLPSDGEKGASVRAILHDMGVVARTVTPEHLGDTAGACARLAGFRPAPMPYTGPSPECEEFILLCGLSDAQVDEYLEKSREAGCVVPHKALLTKINRTWPLNLLMKAVVEEHERLN